MNHWKTIYDSYECSTKWYKFLIGAFLKAGYLDKFMLVCMALVFGYSMHAHIIGSVWGFYILCASAIVLSYMIHRMKQNYVFSVFGDPVLSQARL